MAYISLPQMERIRYSIDRTFLLTTCHSYYLRSIPQVSDTTSYAKLFTFQMWLSVFITMLFTALWLNTNCKNHCVSITYVKRIIF